MPTVTIEQRFRGPPTSGNGGYVCGTFAQLLANAPAAAEVTLRSPVPLDTPMQVEHGSGGVRIRDGETLVAEARAADLQLDVPPAPSFAAAALWRSRSPSLVKGFSARFPDAIGAHPFCFCCGAEHAEGLAVYAAPNDDASIVAAAWQTDPAWCDDAGRVPASFVWTALDCPGQAAYYAIGIRTGMLGQLCARIVHPVRAGERCVVVGWRIAVEGRKHFAGTALFDASARCCAYARAIWIGRRAEDAQR